MSTEPGGIAIQGLCVGSYLGLPPQVDPFRNCRKVNMPIPVAFVLTVGAFLHYFHYPAVDGGTVRQRSKRDG